MALDLRPESECTYAAVSLGEIMLRLSPPGFQRFVQAQQFDAFYGGGEAGYTDYPFLHEE